MSSKPVNDQKQNDVSMEQVEAKEFRQIQLRRYRALSGNEPPKDLDKQKEIFENKDPQNERDLIGLAISGGGIRSATFGLGLLQGLAELDLIKYIDYLSTVSGGGYIGSWFSTWVKREGNLENVVQQLKPLRTDQAAALRGFKGDKSELPRFEVQAMEPEPLFHLRRYSNYLAPRPSMLSTDTWSLLAVYVRNLFANMLAFIPAMLFVLFTIRLLALQFSDSLGVEKFVDPVAGATLLATVASFIMLVFSFMGLQEHETRATQRRELSTQYFRIILTLLSLSALSLTWLLVPPSCGPTEMPTDGPQMIGRFNFWFFGAWSAKEFSVTILAGFAAVFGAIHLLSAIIRAVSKRQRVSDSVMAFNLWWPILSGVLAGAVTGGLLYLGLYFLLWPLAWHQGVVITFGPPLMLISFIVGSNLEVALLGTLGDDREREWWNQLAAWLLIISLVWMVLCGITLFAPLGFSVLNRYLITGVGATWLVTGMSGLWAARSRQTDGKRNSTWKEHLAIFGPYVFLLGLSCLLSWFAQFCLTVNDVSLQSRCESMASHVSPVERPVTGQPDLTVTYESTSKDGSQWNHLTRQQRQTTIESNDWKTLFYQDRCIIANTDRLRLTGMTIAMLALAFVMASRVDINEFSLNAMYANRLTRCYLGASRRKVTKKLSPNAWGAAGGAVARLHGPEWFPNRVTGFDINDDIELKALQIGEYKEPERPSIQNQEQDIPLPDLTNVGYWGPYPLINTALNLVAGDELAWQERKAESFTLSPLFCGNASLGFCPTDQYAGGLSLGRAMAISGAAANPNMGYHSSPAASAMMTLFNVRLGWWLPNPRLDVWKRQRPWFLLKWLAIELFSKTNASRNFLNISDGGHFENLGAYELVRRGCRCIIVSDSAADPGYDFEDLAGLVRKCRTDFGIDIEIDTSPLHPSKETKKTQQHCVVGTIRYDQLDPTAPVGLLVYIKPTLTGDEAAYVSTYAEKYGRFPQQSTADQFFDESQFEAYRALGYHIGQEVFNCLKNLTSVTPSSAALKDPNDIQNAVVNDHHSFVSNMVWCLQKKWLANLPSFERELVAAVEPYVEFHRDIGSLSYPTALTRDLYPGLISPDLDRDTEADVAADLHLAVQMIQVMESAYLKMKLKENYAKSINAGWMNMMHRWSRSKLFQRYWFVLRHEFSRDFVRFCEKELRIPPPADKPLAFESLSPNEKAVMFQEYDREWLTENRTRSLEMISSRAYRYSCPKSGTLKDAFWAIRLSAKDQAGNGVRPIPAGLIGLCPLTESQLPLGSEYLLAAAKHAQLHMLYGQQAEYEGQLRGLSGRMLQQVTKRLGMIKNDICQLSEELDRLPQAFELVLWVRPSFRGHGIGSLLAEFLFHEQLWPAQGMGIFGGRGTNRPKRMVTVYLPNIQRRGSGARHLKQMWLSFFSFYDFRRPAPSTNWPERENYDIMISNCHWRD